MGWFGLFGVGVIGAFSWLFTTNVSVIVVHLLVSNTTILGNNYDAYGTLYFCKGLKLLWMLLH